MSRRQSFTLHHDSDQPPRLLLFTPTQHAPHHFQIGKHIGDLQAALPLRAVCREWAETVALGADEAELDLAPPDALERHEQEEAQDMAAANNSDGDGDAAAAAAAEAATLPAGCDAGGRGDAARRAAFYRRCPFVSRLTYHVSPQVPLAKFAAVLAEAGARLPRLEALTLAFNNGGQRLGGRHLAAVAAALPQLRALRLRAEFEADCDVGAALAPLAALEELVIAPSDAAAACGGSGSGSGGGGGGGLSDAHVASLAALSPALRRLEFPGHARAFTGATLGALRALPALERLAVAPPKAAAPGAAAPAVEYALAHPAAIDALAALTRRRGGAPSAAGASSAATAASPPPPLPPLDLEIGVPDAGWVPRLLEACGPGLGRLSVSVREAAASELLARLCAAPGAARAVVGLDVAFGGAPERADLDAVAAGLPRLERLTITSKCVRPPSARVDAAAALAPLKALRSLHLHINPAWRLPLAPDAVAALAAALPRLERLHLRLGAADHAGLGQLFRFPRLRALSLQWLGEDGSAAAAPLPAAGAGIGGGGRNAGGRGSVDIPVLQLGSLPRALEELSLTSIAAVRLSPPAPFDPAFMAAPPLGALRRLALDGNFGLSDALLPALTSQLPALRSLSLVLAGRQALSGAGLAAAAAALPAPGALEALLVTDYREGPLALDQGCLEGLAPRLPRLRHLKLSTPDIVRAALQPARFAPFARLRRLDLVGCQELAAAALAGALPLCCCKPSPEWAGEGAGAAAAEGAGAGAAEAMAA